MKYEIVPSYQNKNKFHNTDDCCSNCQKCTVYENENRKPSKKYYCEDTDDFIDDIEQHCCDNFEREQ